MKKLSAGVILTDGVVLLVCHVTGRSFYDIPKGLAACGEDPRITCIRETEEETGLHLDPAQLQDLGTFTYTREKDLRLFLCLRKDLPATASMRCRSYFLDQQGRSIPEVDGYRYVSFKEKHRYLVESMAAVIERVHKLMNSLAL